MGNGSSPFPNVQVVSGIQDDLKKECHVNCWNRLCKFIYDSWVTGRSAWKSNIVHGNKKLQGLLLLTVKYWPFYAITAMLCHSIHVQRRKIHHCRHSDLVCNGATRASHFSGASWITSQYHNAHAAKMRRAIIISHSLSQSLGDSGALQHPHVWRAMLHQFITFPPPSLR